ncbi:MAG: hypothetical protein GC206_04940 [Alphaproteobacteria bacterium]|nr:hypothetical protein [Alphaproteobacteria bacterium]
MADKRIRVISVHGTGDSTPTQTSEKWWEPDSPFCQALKQELAAQGIAADYHAFKWSGANSVVDREKAAEALAAEVRQRSKKEEVHIVGHSHGGNVANDAAIYLRWGKKGRRRTIASLTTVGTPYLRSAVSAFQRFGAYFFIAIGVIGAVGLAVTILSSIAYNMLMVGGAPPAVVAGMLLILLIGGIAFYFMLKEAVQGMRRVSRPGSLRSEAAKIFAIWHPRDEAIAVLNAAEAVKIEPFAPGALIRGSRVGGVLWGVRLTILLMLAVLAFVIAHALGVEFGGWAGADCEGLACLGLQRGDMAGYWFVIVTPLAVLGLIWMLIYGLYRLVFGVGAEILFRGAMNRTVRNIFRGMAFGSVGDQRPAAVDTQPSVFNCVRAELDGPLAERIEAGARAAAIALLEKYRGEIFSVGGNHKELFENIPNDAMIWNSLVHTTYFDYPEMAAMIARHIAAAHVAARAD